MFLSYTFCNPDNVSTFLLFQFQIRVKYSEMKLLHKSIDVQFDLIFEKLVLQSFLSWVISGSLEACLVVGVVFGNCADLVNVVSSGQTLQTICNRKNPSEILKLNWGFQAPRFLDEIFPNWIVHQIFSNRPNQIRIWSDLQSLLTWVELSTCWVQLFPVVFGQLCSKRVDGDNEGPAVSLKLKNIQMIQNIEVVQLLALHTA